MKALIISDSHGNMDVITKVLERAGSIDLLIHLGDIEQDEDYIRSQAGCPCYIVAGNNDYFSKLKKEDIIVIEKKKILLTHGHRYNIYYGTKDIEEVARELGMDMVMYGHTHQPNIKYCEDGIVLINPGSIAYPRQEGHRKSFIIMEVDGEKNFHFSIDYL